jgi:hypothetical protein
MNFTNPTTANEFLQVGVNFMNSKPPQFLAASCVFRYLYQIVSQTDRSTISGYLVRCGIELHDKSLINHVQQISLNDTSHYAQLARFMSNTNLHEKMRESCISEAIKQRDFQATDETLDDVILVCAGGEKLMTQLYCNLKSLEVFQYDDTQWGSLQNIKIVVAHANEVTESEIFKFKSCFKTLSIEFFNLCESELVTESNLTADTLKGFQIKLAALVAIRARRVLLMDCDIFWVQDPRHIIANCKRNVFDAHLFCDFWHFVKHRHEKSASTSFLYSLHGIDYNISEFESGVLYFDREKAYTSVAILKHMVINYEYYFSLTFGDKDLYYLALKSQNAKISISDPPKMLGYLCQESNVFNSQSMLQSFNSKSSHIHTTLHPIGDDGFDIPTHICDDAFKIRFVQRTIKNKVVHTVGCDQADIKVLETPNIYRHLYACALRDYSKEEMLLE